MLTLRHRLVTLLMPFALCLGLATVGFGHRGLAASPERAFIDNAAVLGVARADLCGAGKDHGDAVASACEACRLVSSAFLPPRTGTAPRKIAAALADWQPRARQLVPFVTADRNDPARAPPLV